MAGAKALSSERKVDHIQHNKQNTSYQNLTRKAIQTETKDSLNKGQTKNTFMPKKNIKNSLKMMDFKDTLYVKPPVDQLNLERENQNVKDVNDKQISEAIPDVQLITDKQQDQSSYSIQDTLQKLEKKLESAKRKMESNFGAGRANKEKVPSKQVSNFLPKIVEEKVYVAKHNADDLLNTADHSDIKNTAKTLFLNRESTAPMTSKGSAGPLSTPMNETSQFNYIDEAYTPAQFKSNISKNTDESGNRLSILPGSSRPKAPSSKKKTPKTNTFEQEEDKNATMLEKIQNQVKVLKGSKNIKKGGQERQNFVRLNMKQNYKPHARGGIHTNKIMAKKRNELKFRDRYKRKMQIEAAQNRDQVNIYGGLGKVGLDHQGGLKETGEQDDDQLAPTFSASAMRFVKKVKYDSEEDDLLADDLEQLDNVLSKIDEVVADDDDQDKPMYKIPKDDEGFKAILKERFGFDDFLEGQLEAIKILLHKKENTLVVLATGGGKSLVYQYVAQFLPGLIVIVTPLISLMTDQLGKLPDFMPGACLNSQQTFDMKKQIIKTITEKHIKVVFISPERFFMEDFSKFERKISMVCVDEIHCASEWSHNFRPAYLKLHDMIRDKLGQEVLVLGLTATATKATQRQICDIFDIKHPEHIVTQPDLSRLNLHLSITRDQEKLKSLLALLRSDSFKKLTSILIFATHKRTTEQLASHLTQNGINSAAYHAGKTDAQRSMIQKMFITNQTRVLVCTIAFSMGIDKSDIQSVIHYDIPRSIESYVQEIGRSGRDGKLARCHMFLNNDDFYQLRRIILTDLLDNQNALKLTNKIIVESKKELISKIKPELVATKKRKMKQISGEEHKQIIEEFEHESHLTKLYVADEGTNTKNIDVENFDELEAPLYVFLNVKETCSLLDLKKEVILTMLNQLEKLSSGKGFYKLESILPAQMGVRFHTKKPEELAKDNTFLQALIENSKEFQGVYRCSVPQLAYSLKMNPFNIPKILYNLQNNEDTGISYELDHESFVLKLKSIPSGGQTMDLAESMLSETRRIEKNMVQKLNCMYFCARKVSLPTVEYMLKKERTEDMGKMYQGFSKQLNDLINMYFNIKDEENMEVQIAGSKEERDIMMPLQYIGTSRDKADLESDIRQILREFHDSSQSAGGNFDPNERMKPLDVTKVLMGIYSDRQCVKRFMNNTKVWARRQSYDYEDILEVAQQTVSQFYLEQVSGGSTPLSTLLNNGPSQKLKKMNSEIETTTQ